MRSFVGAVRILVVVLAMGLLVSATDSFAQAANPSVGNLFIEAYSKKDEKRMRELIKTRGEEFPPEVKDMVGYAMSGEATPQEQDFLFNIAGTIASMLAEETKDERLLNAVKANYQQVMETRQKSKPGVSEDAINKAKKELVELGKGDWRVTIFEVTPDGKLTAEIDVKEGAGGEMTPKISIPVANKAKDEVMKVLPTVKSGSISWLCLGVALKTIFIE